MTQKKKSSLKITAIIVAAVFVFLSVSLLISNFGLKTTDYTYEAKSISKNVNIVYFLTFT